jgi:uncharacterized membrane protein
MTVGGTARRAMAFALAGVVIGGLIGWFAFGGTGLNTATGNYGWGVLMAPTFAVVGGIVGLLNYFLIASWHSATTRVAKGLDDNPAAEDPINQAEWDDPDNWFAGVVYHSQLDTRTFVPKRLGGFGVTINIRRPFGLAIATAIVVLIILILIVSIK